MPLAVADLAPLAVTVPIIGGALLALVGRHLPRLVIDALTLLVVAVVLGLDLLLLRACADGRVVSWLGGWTPTMGAGANRTGVGIAFVADRVGAGTATLAAALVLIAAVYSWRYFATLEAHVPALTLLFLAGMTGFALSGDLFDMFVFFELMGVAAYALTGLKVEDASAVQGGFTFGVVNSVGAYAALLGVALLYGRTGELGLPQLGHQLAGRPADQLTVAAFVLVGTAFAVKAALAPFHFWLSDAHAVAPAPICLLFSGVMVELGVYGIGRLWWTVFSGGRPPVPAGRVLLVLGVLTAVVGAVMCPLQRNVKRLLAFSTVAHSGLFVVALGGLAPAPTAGVLLYVAGHAGAKGALFLSAGMLLDRHRSVDEIGLYGRGGRDRLLGALIVVGGLALAGMPPFGTALGKSVAEEALAGQGLGFAPVLFVVVSALTAAAVLRAAGRIFYGLGSPPAPPQGEQTTGEEEGPDREPSDRAQPGAGATATLTVPIVVLLIGSLLIGVLPQVSRWAAAAGAQFCSRIGYASAALSGSTGLVTEASSSGQSLPDVGWTAQGVLTGLISAGLALGLAATALYGRGLPARAGRVVRFVIEVWAPVPRRLHRLHSGRIGDDVAWLLFGVAGMGVLLLA